MSKTRDRDAIKDGKTALGLELGSTRIKTVLVNEEGRTLASGSFGWENARRDGYWTYALEDVWQGTQTAYAALAQDAKEKYQVAIEQVGAIGISAMMHGYLPFDREGKLLVPFRTWRNVTTGEAAAELSELFAFNVPQRRCIAHLYQAILHAEPHVEKIAFLTTLAGYVHWQLSGERVLGVGDASGMFPLDGLIYDAARLTAFSKIISVTRYPWQIQELLPKPLPAGAMAGRLTAEGARLLDPSGQLQPGALLAPPEGDAGTGMVATNAVRERTGNISIGTSAFSMNVLDRPLKTYHRDVDIVATPAGAPVAMVHTNNCSSDIDAWAGLFAEFARALGRGDLSPAALYALLFGQAAAADRDAGGLLSYACLAGENITEVPVGRPLFVRKPTSRFTLANFMLAQLYAAFAPLRIGMEALMEEEGVKADVMIAQGGLFKTPIIAQQALADVLDLPIRVMASAGEGGPWGMAVLALYARAREQGERRELADYLDEEIFQGAEGETREPTAGGVKGAAAFLACYRAALSVERLAGEKITD